MHKFTDFNPSLTKRFSFDTFLAEMNTNKKPNIKDATLDAFYKTLEDSISAKKSFKQEGFGTMQYSKEVENIQAALNFLGYDLPKYGVDGLFGPETGKAVAKFKKEHPVAVKIGRAIMERNADAMMNGISQAGGDIKAPDQIDGAGDVTQDLSIIIPNIVKAIEDLDIEVTMTSGNDEFHANRRSRHASGEAVDFAISPNHSAARIAVEKIIRNFMAGAPGLSYINEYDKPSAHATGGHFHVSYRKDDPENNGIGLVGSEYVPSVVKIEGGDLVGSDIGEVITPNFVKAMIDMLKKKSFSAEDLKTYSKKLGPAAINLDIKDFDGIVAQVIDKLEGGYYHPDMLQDGRVGDSRYSNSGETMMGIDRQAGGNINTTPEGIEFWNLIDAENARTTWKWNYRGGDLEDKLRELAGKMIKRYYDQFAQKYLSSKALTIVNDDPRLLFNFVYAVWNGSGWFQRFAKVINSAVESGDTNPDSLAQLAIKTRIENDNSLIAQGGRKLNDLLGTGVV